MSFVGTTALIVYNNSNFIFYSYMVYHVYNVSKDIISVSKLILNKTRTFFTFCSGAWS